MALSSIPARHPGWGCFPACRALHRALAEGIPVCLIASNVTACRIGMLWTRGLPTARHVAVWRLRSLMEERHGSEDGECGLVCRH